MFVWLQMNPLHNPFTIRARYFFAGMLFLSLGVIVVTQPSIKADDANSSRKELWESIQRSLNEGKPKTAAQLLKGIEEQARAEEAWDEVARAIATRILTETGDRPPDDPARLIRLAEEIKTAPQQTQHVLHAIQANWIWGFYQQNQWRYRTRTQGGAGGTDLSKISQWDLPTIIAEIRKQFKSALGDSTDTKKKVLQSLPVTAWDALLQKGSMSDAYRPTVWDVVVHDALVFLQSGERGLIAPEDAFEIDVRSPALGTLDDFLSWHPESDDDITDRESPILEAALLYRELITFHRDDADPSAFLSADLERILWASEIVVGDGVDKRKEKSLRIFIEHAEKHETAARASFVLATLLRQHGDLVQAHATAQAAASAHPKTHGGAQCANLVKQIEAKTLSVSTERTWAKPFPSIRITYRNLEKVHIRVCKADWLGRLKTRNAYGSWMDDTDRKAMLTLPAVREHTADLPHVPDYQEQFIDLPVGSSLDAANLDPGSYWVIASQKPGFGDIDNVVSATLVWVTRLAIITEQSRGTFATEAASVQGQPRQPAQRGNQQQGNPIVNGFIVDVRTGEPIQHAEVKVFARERKGNAQVVEQSHAVTTNASGRFELEVTQGQPVVIVASADVEGRQETVANFPRGVGRNIRQAVVKNIILMTDRGIHRPGQIVFYKGIAATGDQARAQYAALSNVIVDVTLRDANGRDVATSRHTTNANGSFHGNFSIPSGCLPGRWSLRARTANTQGSVGVRVEEYKRPKFEVTIASPKKSVPLGDEISLSGTAATYTGLPVTESSVRWRVERTVRFPIWCRSFFPWLPFDGGAQRIARGTTTTDATGAFQIVFPALADRSVPKESLPVFTYKVVAEVTDRGGETRSDEKVIRAGYTDIDASLAVDEWQSVANGTSAHVDITISTSTLDGEPRTGTGVLKVHRLVQPSHVDRGNFFGNQPSPRVHHELKPLEPPAPNPAIPETWSNGEAVFETTLSTDTVSGKKLIATDLPVGLYRVTFEIPAKGATPAVRATKLVEVINPNLKHYTTKRAFILKTENESVAPGETFTALIGTGYESGRVHVEISQAGKILKQYWTKPGQTQWPIAFDVTESNRGGFTVNAWIVKEGRLHRQHQTVDVPWKDKQLTIEWDRFTRKTEPGSKEVWRARIRSVANAITGEASPQTAELLAVLYDKSLDALSTHAWPGSGLNGLFRRESGWTNLTFSNAPETLRRIRGRFTTSYVRVPVMSFRELRPPFGVPRGGIMFSRSQMYAAESGHPAMALDDSLSEAPMMRSRSMMAKAAPASADQQNAFLGDKEALVNTAGVTVDDTPITSKPSSPPPRRNLIETAFFMPSLSSGKDGLVTIEFSVPDTLTTWQFKGLAHDAHLRSGTLSDTCISSKDLMVEPMLPRFFREGDTVVIPIKVSNASTGRLAGTVKFSLADAQTDANRDELIEGPSEKPFDLAAGESQAVLFNVGIADGTDVLRYLATGTASESGRQVADGEEAYIPVLPRRVLVTETVPITIRGPGKRDVVLERLSNSTPAHKTPDGIQNQSLVIQAVSNPAWYAVLALPVIMEETDESTEGLFSRLYANMFARHLATSDPQIQKIFELWKNTETLTSPLERNADLFKTLLSETPWIRDAVDETAARARIALLFDTNRANNEVRQSIERLEKIRNADGGWPWFPGGRTCDSVTLGIMTGFGRLHMAGVDIDLQTALRAIPWLDKRLIEERERALRQWGKSPDDMVLTPIGVYALYARSFFTQHAPPTGKALGAIEWAFDVADTSWMKLDARRSQGQLAIAMSRYGNKETARSIIESLKQRAVDADVQPGAEADSWQGMWWRDPHPGWWSWAHAPIATQAIMIEAFDEVAGDADAVEALKVWLLSQKRTSRWPGSRATADAVGALIGRGKNLLRQQELVMLTVGKQTISPQKTEAGTGFFETRFIRSEINPDMATISLEKQDEGLAFGGVHWQYLDDIANISANGHPELTIEKKLFVKKFTKSGPSLEPLDHQHVVDIGDELVVRLVVTSDRDYEFLELSDHRPSLSEPMDVLSGWRYGDGAAWYVAIRDASTRMFFERLPRGTHVFEYSLRVTHSGNASSGFATIQSRYAPEFSAHSKSISLSVK